MTKRVYIIHGWGDSPDSAYRPWLKKELEQKGFEVHIPAMPDTDEPKIKPWVSKLNELVGEADKDTYFIGQSIGCQTIMRYLQTLENKKIGGAIFVAGWFNLVNLPDEEEEEIAKPWIETKINLEKVKSTTDNFVAVFSDNDPWVPLSDKDIFEKELGAKIIVEHNKGHFGESDKITELPIILEELSKM